MPAPLVNTLWITLLRLWITTVALWITLWISAGRRLWVPLLISLWITLRILWITLGISLWTTR